MNILIIGSGAREHAIAQALHRSPQKPAIFCCGTATNPGIKQMTHNYWVGDICNVEAVAAVAAGWQINLAIIGPEAPSKKAWRMFYGVMRFPLLAHAKAWRGLKPARNSRAI